MAQYFKTIICGIITLYSSRVILSSLGVTDFGLYSLIAGVVVMMTFLTNALSWTTQRFISFYQGSGELLKVKVALTSSLCIHVVLGLLFAAVLLSLIPFLFNGFLNIEPNRISAAISIYYAVIATLFVSFINAPYRALLISHENIIYISIIDTLDVILKLLIALSLVWISFDKLIYYGWALLFIQFFNLTASAVFCYVRYEECTWPRISEISKTYVKGLSSFASWNLYSLACTFGRTQGIAIVLNKFLGTIINASYGLGLQLSSYVNYMAESLLNAIRPQIIKAEGGKDREKMFLLSEKASKFSFFLLSLLTIPCVAETQKLLELWLGEYPDEAIVFCRCFLFANLVDSLSIGLHTANQAIGNLKNFSLIINTAKLLTLPISYLILFIDAGVMYVCFAYVLIEFVCAILRLLVMQNDGLHIRRFVRNVFLKTLPPFFICIFLSFLIVSLYTGSYRILVNFGTILLIYPILIILFGLDSTEYLLFKKTVSNISAWIVRKSF